MKKYIFFDFDDTLYFTHSAKKRSLEYCLKDISHINIHTQTIFMLQKARKSDLLIENPANIINIISAFDNKNTPTNISNYYDKYRAKFFELLERNEIIFEQIEIIKSINPKIKIVILTNNYIQSILEILKNNGELNKFDSIISPEFFGSGKSAFFYQAVLQLFSIHATDCLMIGDNVLTDGSCVDVGIEFLNVKEFQTFEKDKLHEIINS